MDTSRRGFLKGLLSGLGALTALPLIAGTAKASEVFENKPSSLEEELAKMFLDVGNYKMTNVEALSIMRDWKHKYQDMNKYSDFVNGMTKAFSLAKKTDKGVFYKGFRSCCDVLLFDEQLDRKRPA